MKVGDTSPWGGIQILTPFGEGIWFVSTASHGGFFLDAERNAKVPASWRRGTFREQGIRGWYEEDEDWCLVIKTFPERFPAEDLKKAKAAFSWWEKPRLAHGGRLPHEVEREG